MKVVVLYGGISGEREVSLSTGKGVINALQKKGHDVIGIDFHPDKIKELTELDADIVFIGLHGKFGEDGRIQGLLDMLNMPYVGSGVLASALAMDKSKAKQIFEQNGIPVAKGKTYYRDKLKDIASLKEEITESFPLPFVIKPNQEGSTLGLHIVNELEKLEEAIYQAFEHDQAILLEEYVKGKELTVAVWGQKGQESAFPVIEIVPKNEYYDYESKYTEGGSDHIIPANIDETVTSLIQQYAVKAHQLLGCETYSRVDFILNELGEPIILEVNTLPGMTPTSLFPDAAKAVGISYEEMIEKFIKISLQQ
ncbi:D-alanine-D-alanine ligase [Salirhabdus euzebyi]|uniref:D-alanine--D-alanine ligase n=1 Tax=Salirhabdus euzebyi TaxID=394506 RepID=A0A841PYQ4_9BACI|nr:D-alanine--D-alanine ligase [Salirhabdus euzebyi]MBB6452181.1 D-alanine-D-alanine ligase [Salirhabdus euzebyi]